MAASWKVRLCLVTLPKFCCYPAIHCGLEFAPKGCWTLHHHPIRVCVCVCAHVCGRVNTFLSGCSTFWLLHGHSPCMNCGWSFNILATSANIMAASWKVRLWVWLHYPNSAVTLPFTIMEFIALNLLTAICRNVCTYIIHIANLEYTHSSSDIIGVMWLVCAMSSVFYIIWLVLCSDNLWPH